MAEVQINDKCMTEEVEVGEGEEVKWETALGRLSLSRGTNREPVMS